MATRFQRFMLRVIPRAWAESLEAGTRQWVLRCPCGHEQDLWEAGGMRGGSTGSKSKTYLLCPGCGKKTWQSVERRVGANFG